MGHVTATRPCFLHGHHDSDPTISDDVYRKLNARAVLAGMSFCTYAVADLIHGLERPTTDQ